MPTITMRDGTLIYDKHARRGQGVQPWNGNDMDTHGGAAEHEGRHQRGVRLRQGVFGKPS